MKTNTNEESPLNKMIRMITAHGEGPVPEDNISSFESILYDAWPLLDGSDSEGMNPDKILGRTENLCIEDGRVCFDIERHGALVMGSAYAEIQWWAVDPWKQMAMTSCSGKRRIHPIAKSFKMSDAVAAALDLYGRLDAHEEHPAIAWNKDGSAMLTIKSWIDLGDYKLTRETRSKRFKSAVIDTIESSSWKLIPCGTRLKFGPREAAQLPDVVMGS
jgi:hypothetical protein